MTPTCVAIGERLAALGHELSDAGAPHSYLVGGVVRDLVLGRGVGRDVDVVVEGDAIDVARRLARARGVRLRTHRAFGTATLLLEETDLDLITARAETYPRPGALPVVAAGSLLDDLRRRDFTVNALATRLVPAADGRVIDPCGGLDDIRLGLVRTLHRRSFRDDPTRVIRAARYAGRLSFALADTTRAEALAAIAGGALATVSGARLRDALFAALAETEALAVVDLLRDLGALAAVDAALVGDDLGLVAFPAAVGPAAPALRLGLLLAGSSDAELRRVARRLRLSTSTGRIVRAAAQAPAIGLLVASVTAGDVLADLLDPLPDDVLPLVAACVPAAAPTVDRYRRDLRDRRLPVDGDVLQSELGLVPGPRLGEVLRELRRQHLRGDIESRAEALSAARSLLAADQRGVSQRGS